MGKYCCFNCVKKIILKRRLLIYALAVIYHMISH